MLNLFSFCMLGNQDDKASALETFPNEEFLHVSQEEMMAANDNEEDVWIAITPSKKEAAAGKEETNKGSVQDKENNTTTSRNKNNKSKKSSKFQDNKKNKPAHADLENNTKVNKRIARTNNLGLLENVLNSPSYKK